jgi:hypothetical protein
MSLHKKQGERSKLAVDGGRTQQFLTLGIAEFSEEDY